jgi:hypothetical protein
MPDNPGYLSDRDRALTSGPKLTLCNARPRTWIVQRAHDNVYAGVIVASPDTVYKAHLGMLTGGVLVGRFHRLEDAASRVLECRRAQDVIDQYKARAHTGKVE